MNNRKKKGSEFKEWVEGIRAKHQIYPSGKGIFLNLLDVCGLTYEVFLHGRMGQRYFGIFKTLFSSLFILCMMIFSTLGFEVGGVISPYTPGIVKSGLRSIFQPGISSSRLSIGGRSTTTLRKDIWIGAMLTRVPVLILRNGRETRERLQPV